jgi:capsular exopolysaccharide synthesis family protein
MRPLPLPKPNDSKRLPEPRAADRGIARYEPSLYEEPLDEDSLDLRELWRIAVKYRRKIALFAAIVLVTVATATLIRLPVYRATAVMELTPEQENVVQFQNVQAAALDDHTFQQTQIRILRSRAIAAAVIERLDLGSDPAFNGELRQRDLIAGSRELVNLVATPIVSSLKRLLHGAETRDETTRDLTTAADSDTEAVPRALVNRLLAGLTVTPVRSSNLVEVSFESFDPELAAQVANAVVEEYLKFSAKKSFERWVGAESYLQEEIADLQAQLETSEKELYDFARTNQVVDLEDRNNIIATRLTELNADLAEIKGERIAAESLYQQLREGKAESFPAVLQNEEIASLTGQLAGLRSEYARLSQTYTDAYPKLQELKSQIATVQATREEALGKVVSGFETRYKALIDREQRLAKAVDEQKQELLNLQDRAIQYNILKREWETNSGLYSGLLERMKEVGVAAGMKQDTASIIDRAIAPPAPFAPSLTRNLAIALMLGLGGGFGLAMLLNMLDSTVRHTEDIERLVHLPNLGLLPKLDPKRLPAGASSLDLAAATQRSSSLAEAFRSLRTSLMFATPGGTAKVLAVSSATPGEGKSTSAANLAVVLAQTGASVLLVDADLRKPRLHAVFKVPRGPGLTDQLVQMEGDTMIHTTSVENLSFLAAGTLPPNPAELLSSAELDRLLEQLSRRFDHIVIDTSPVMGLADPVVLSTKVDGVVLVCAAGRLGRGALREAVKRLRAVDAPLLGATLNMVEPESSEYGYYSRYYYNYGSDAQQSTSQRDLQTKAA